jgi:hypothetical protein
LNVRIILITVFPFAAGWLAYRMEEEPKGITPLIMACLIPLLFLGWALIRFKVLPVSTQPVFFNIPIVVMLLMGLFLCRKHGIMRTFMLGALSGYLFEYVA